MKTGKTLVELATEIERQQQSKKDLVASTLNMRAVVNGTDRALKLVLGDEHEFGVNDVAHRQVSEHVKIPATYYDRMRVEAPALLATNLNHWFTNNPAPRMVRTLDGSARAFLSDRYRPLENGDLAEAVLPPLLEMGVEVMSCEITERRMYIKAIDKRVCKDLPAGWKWGRDHHITRALSPAITISNSEVGMGALSIEAGCYDGFCTNLATFGSRSMRKYHIGGKHELGDALYALLSEKTRRITDAAVWSQVGDVVKGAFAEAQFEAAVNEIAGMTEQKIEGDPIKVVEVAAKKFGATDGERTSILKHLIEGGDLSRFGLYNAITRAAQDLPDYDRATEFERLGGKVVELPRHEWQELAKAA